MPEIPHEYTVAGKATVCVPPVPDAWYVWFVAQIREHCYQANFGGRTYTYLHVDGWKYWSLPGQGRSDDHQPRSAARRGVMSPLACRRAEPRKGRAHPDCVARARSRVGGTVRVPGSVELMLGSRPQRAIGSGLLRSSA
jgi:hypothetical protein